MVILQTVTMGQTGSEAAVPSDHGTIRNQPTPKGCDESDLVIVRGCDQCVTRRLPSFHCSGTHQDPRDSGWIIEFLAGNFG
jgi:hypothetical protein